MAEGLNRVMLLGNLGADPELRSTASGESVLRLRLATTEKFMDRNKEMKERTEWHSVTVWGKRAEGLHRILTKGTTIFVEGSLRTSSYDDKDGVKRYKTEVIAQNIILAGRSHDAGTHTPAHRPPPAAPAQRPNPPAQQPAASGGDDYGSDDYGSDDDIPF